MVKRKESTGENQTKKQKEDAAQHFLAVKPLSSAADHWQLCRIPALEGQVKWTIFFLLHSRGLIK